MALARVRSLGSCVGLVTLVGACFDPGGETPLDPTLGLPPTTTAVDPTASTSEGSGDMGTSSGSVDPSSGNVDSSSGNVDTSSGGVDTSSTTAEGSSGPAAPVCGNGIPEDGEECDDGNPSETDECLSTCVSASCGDGLVHAGVEQCDDGNVVETDDCPSMCLSASCGDGFVQAGVEQCDDGNLSNGDGCGAACLAECGNPGGGALSAENGTGMGVMYCYEAADSTQTRAQKACESHFGVGNCCIIFGGYQDQQYGQCGFSGEAGTLHWHWDFHPVDHCEPFYVPGDVVSPGWCGVILGNFLD